MQIEQALVANFLGADIARPGLLVGFLLVFVPALGELSATILLYSSGTETIAVAIARWLSAQAV